MQGNGIRLGRATTLDRLPNHSAKRKIEALEGPGFTGLGFCATYKTTGGYEQDKIWKFSGTAH
jgi:hypothetical protein